MSRRALLARLAMRSAEASTATGLRNLDQPAAAHAWLDAGVDVVATSPRAA